MLSQQVDYLHAATSFSDRFKLPEADISHGSECQVTRSEHTSLPQHIWSQANSQMSLLFEAVVESTLCITSTFSPEHATNAVRVTFHLIIAMELYSISVPSAIH